MTMAIKELEERLLSFPRVSFLNSPTPIEPLARLNSSGLLNGVELFIKRDDLGGLGGGGSKLRKLEFLFGDALAKGCDTVISFGGRQSNSARLTAAAAAKVGLQAELVLAGPIFRTEDYEKSGNVLLDTMFGAKVHDVPTGTTPEVYATELAGRLRAQGRSVYLMPMASSSAVGNLGYVAGSLELAQQSQALGIRWDCLVLPNGSGGSHAGLVVGLNALGGAIPQVKGYAVLSDARESVSRTLDFATRTANRVGLPKAIEAEDILIDDRSLGGGYGQPTEESLSAIRLMASQEGLLLDPVYGGKAFAGLLGEINARRFQAGQKVLFLMTGGTPGLFAYRELLPAI